VKNHLTEIRLKGLVHRALLNRQDVKMRQEQVILLPSHHGSLLCLNVAFTPGAIGSGSGFDTASAQITVSDIVLTPILMLSLDD
jgi:hypothetical protein